MLCYKGEVIRKYFQNFEIVEKLKTEDSITYQITLNKIEWEVTLVETGQDTKTGGRLLRVKSFIDGTFCLTYGDG